MLMATATCSPCRDAAFWVHNYVANQAYNRYSQMIPDIRRVQNGLEDSIASAVKVVEAEVMTLPDVRQREELSNFSDFWANHSTKEFKKLGDYLLVKYIDGNIKRETEPGVFKRTPEECAHRLNMADIPRITTAQSPRMPVSD